MAQPPKLRDGQRRVDADGRPWLVENGRWRREAPWETVAVGARRTLEDADRFVEREVRPRLDAVLAPPARAPRRSQRAASEEPLRLRRLPMVPQFVADGRAAGPSLKLGLLPAATSAPAPAGAGRYDVDRAFLLEQEAAGGPKLDMYVPTVKDRPDLALENSGPTIGAGVDLGRKDAAYLRRVGVDPATIDKLSPYFGMTRQKALDYVRAHPLSLSEAEVAALDAAVQDDHIAEIARTFDAASKVGRFDQLPRSTQTAVASLYFQYGPNEPWKTTPQYWTQITTGDWEGAHRNLRKFGDAYPSRRGREADLMKKDIEAGTLPRAAR
ncbi:pesticin C-terminus-like muramidase [Caulobacter sp. 17J80-11]|uniref:pesticin C-terminus-like muramidase n=1 Tax=Caulobacter sp. 17J80-11 TaxID=2763502 RepID=UPI0016539CA1|nr:pesticin C-terminus-like muramidase [Caulobacter sp. 17J80-11]MBC6982128.1 hypothetical protein [Caulobacter sp. 17J80-11]